MKKRRPKVPKVYLLHFQSPLLDSQGRPKSQHYLGMSRNIQRRLELHRTGQSNSRIMRALFEKGIAFEVVATWDGDEHLERALKRKKRATMLCPKCHEVYLRKERERGAKRRLASQQSAPVVQMKP